MASPQGNTAYISFSGIIREAQAESVINAAIQATNTGVDTLVLCLASLGGGFGRALSLGNMLRAMPPRFVTYNVGLVASAANTLFLAGEQRCAEPYATFSFHPSSTEITGSVDPTQLAEHRASLLADDAREEQIIMQTTGLDKAKVRAIIQRSKTLTAQEAKELGLVEEVNPLLIQPGSLILSA